MGYLESELKLQINPDKSGVARASQRDFLGYGMIGRDEARLKVAPASVQRLRQKVNDLLRASRGTNVAGASHLNHAFPKSYFDHLGLVSLVDNHRRFQNQS